MLEKACLKIEIFFLKLFLELQRHWGNKIYWAENTFSK